MYEILNQQVIEIEKRFLEVEEMEFKQYEAGFALAKRIEGDEIQPIIPLPDELHFYYVSEKKDTPQEAALALIDKISPYVDQMLEKYGPAKLYWRSIPIVDYYQDFAMNKGVYRSRCRGSIIPEKLREQEKGDEVEK
jgi:hypothetical protein